MDLMGFQLKRLKLRKNNWDCETYQFDEVLTETASQKRVYEVVAKPVVEVHAFPTLRPTPGQSTFHPSSENTEDMSCSSLHLY